MLQRNSINKNDNASNTDNFSVEKGKCYLVKGPKPLQKFRFYLDVKNYAITTKLEQKIKDLGGAVDYFLVREVTHVISDRETSASNSVDFSPRTPSGSVEINYESPKPSTSTPKAGQSRLKTRADAMLEKVRTQTQAAVADPLKNAKLWGIPIWTVNKVFSWLEKVSANISLSKSAHKQKPKSLVRELSLTAPYVKFEPLARDARPVYKSLDSWPVLDIEGRPGSCPFKMKPKPEIDNEPIIDSKMTRRNKPRISMRNSKESDEKPHSQEKILNGYCEICHLEYRELQEHLDSETHQQFVKNDSNYLTLDTLIGQTTNVDQFLRLNGGTICKDGLRRSLRVVKSPNGKYNGLDDDRPMTRGRSNYNKRFSSSLSALSPTGSDSGHKLRSRTNMHSPVNNYILSPEDESLSPKSQKNCDRKNSRSSEDLHENCIKENSERFPEHGKSKKTCPKTKRISADERLVSDNKTYYKVEVMTTKLRSSGLGSHYDHSTAKNQSPITEEPEHHQEPSSLVVKFKKIRRSELETLNDEAENFMFPRKEDSSFEDMGTDDGPNTTRSPQKEHTLEIPSSEYEKTPKNKEHFDNNEEFLEKIYLRNIKSLMKDKKTDDLDETSGKRKTRKIIDYHEDNSESDSIIRTRPKKPVNYLELKIIDENSDSNSLIKTRPKNKNISYLEESSIDEEILTNTPINNRKNNIITNEDLGDEILQEDSKSSESKILNMTLRVPRKKFIIKTFKVKRPLKQKFKKAEVVQNTKLKIMKKKFKSIVKPINIKPLNHKKQKFTKRKLLSKKNSSLNKKLEIIPDNLDETAQDGTELIEIKRGNSSRKKKVDAQPSSEDLEISKDATSRDSVSLCDSEGRRRGRRKQAELFIEENQKYFKFESPVSRLRYQGSVFGAIKSPPRLNGEQEEEVSNKERPEFHLDEVKYFFEIEPKSEPWYETFTRQDRGEERYTSLSDPGYQTRLILPYQIPAPFYPLDPQVCISHYDRIKKYVIDPESEDVKEAPEQTEDSQAASEIAGEVQKEKSRNTNNTEIKHPEKISTISNNKIKFNRRRRKRFNMKVQNHPRKSPRQHASTLAILSSLINQRKKRKSGGESDLSRSSLGPVPEESPEKLPEQPEEESLPIKNEDLDNLEFENDEKVFKEEIHKEIEAHKCVSEILSTPIELDFSDELEGIVLKDAPDAIDLIENYNEYDCHELPMLGLTGRSVKRKCKKKRNTTGWPSPKKRLFPRKVTKNGENTSLEDQTGLSEGSAEVNDSEKCSEYSNSDLENRTNLNLDSVDSNCNINSSEQNLKQGLQKLNNTENNTDLIKNVLQPLDKIKKNNCEMNNKSVKSRLRSSSSPDRKPKAKKAKIQASPRSPRKLRAPRGKWYRER